MFSAVLELTKYRLSISVLFSSIAGYLIAINTFSIEISPTDFTHLNFNSVKSISEMLERIIV